MKKNDIEHEVKVKLMDSILNNDRNYQWFLDYLENNFDYDDIDSWENFENRYVSFLKIFDYFSKIQKIESEELKTDIVLLKDIILISRFNLDLITWSQLSIKVQSNFGKIIAVALYITKLMSLKNQLNDEKSIFAHYKKMIDLRQNGKYSDCLIYGEFIPVPLENKKIIAYVRKYGNQKLLCISNFSELKQEVKLNDIAKVLGEKEITLGEILINNFDKIGKDEKKLNLEGFQSLLVEI